MPFDPLLLNRERDLLGNILNHAADTQKCSQHITVQIREIISTRVVALFERGIARRVSAAPRDDIHQRGEPTAGRRRRSL